MPGPRLELSSSHGDQTISGARFIVHGTSGTTETISVLDNGLPITEGKSQVTTNILYARDWTHYHQSPDQISNLMGGSGEPGTVVVYAVPPSLHLGYGIFTSAYIERSTKRVTGAPLRYAAARNHLSLYLPQDTEAARVHVEAEIANGLPIEQQTQYQADARFLVGSFVSSSTFDTSLNELDTSVRAMEPVDFEKLGVNLSSTLRTTSPANAVLVPSIIRSIIIGTIESLIMSRLRMMRWQGLGALGFSFYEGNEQVTIPPVQSVEEQKKRMDELGRRLASSQLFNAELAWLKGYGTHELELMRIELEGAELEL